MRVPCSPRPKAEKLLRPQVGGGNPLPAEEKLGVLRGQPGQVEPGSAQGLLSGGRGVPRSLYSLPRHLLIPLSTRPPAGDQGTQELTEGTRTEPMLMITQSRTWPVLPGMARRGGGLGRGVAACRPQAAKPRGLCLLPRPEAGPHWPRSCSLSACGRKLESERQTRVLAEFPFQT